MHRRIKHAKKGVGLPPGTLLHPGEIRAEKMRLILYTYDAGFYRQEEVRPEELAERDFSGGGQVHWLQVVGLSSVPVIEQVGNCFSLHPLVLEDILTTDQRPKLEDYGDYTYLVLKMFHHQHSGDAYTEQISIVLGRQFVLSFQETDGALFTPVVERLKNAKGRFRSQGADYLAYALLDTVVDNYFVLLENLGEQIELLEDKLIVEPDRQTLTEIYSLKNDMLFMRKAIWPLREIVNALDRGESKLFCENTLIYLRDVYDHIIQVIDTVETYRDMVSGMLDIYLSSVSHKLNEVMKLLTIISTIFIPLTFIAGVYGMNFKYMPELEWEYGYPVVWFVMLAVAAVMVRYFHKRKWI